MRLQRKATGRGPVVLLTDFGPGSAYVGQMKMVLARRAPGAQVLDLAHDVPPQALGAASLILENAWSFLPDRSVLVAVIDPGVGSRRRIVAARFSNESLLLVPDNGVLPGASGLPRPGEVRALTCQELFLKPVSPVFHGRDIFAPVAAHLANGGAFNELGPLVRYESLVPAPWRAPVLGASVHGVRVIHVDRFGNLITNLRADGLEGRNVLSVRCRRRGFPFVTHYQAVESGRPLSLIGSHGRLELAIGEGSAAATLGVGMGTPVKVRLGTGT